jgi:hypothetical protein
MKKIIYDDDGREHVVGSAESWTQVHQVCFECGLPIDARGSEGPDAFYVSPPRRTPRPFWPPRHPFAVE